MKNLLSVAVISALLFATHENASAQWSRDPNANNAISIATDYQQFPAAISDGAGGAIIAWTDYRNGAVNYDIYAQRVDRNGVVQWAANGVPICTAPNGQANPRLVSDGAGGAIISWSDQRNLNVDIYAQRINAAGVVQWAADGVPIDTLPSIQTDPTVVSDGAGGAIIAWIDRRAGNADIYAQRINGSGAVQWTPNGIPVCTEASDQEIAVIVQNGSGGAIIAWQDLRNGNNDIYAQCVDASGARQWIVTGDSNGVPISLAPLDQTVPVIVSDGAGGAIIVWQDQRNSDYDIYAQRINGAGLVRWTTDGVAITTAPNWQTDYSAISDGRGGAIITWDDGRHNGETDIYAQKINGAGILQWSDSTTVCTAPNLQQSPVLVGDGIGGAIISWYDFRDGNADVYAQSISAEGLGRWKANGVVVSNAVSSQNNPFIVSDGNGGGIITWTDFRNGPTSDIYAQKVDRNGFLGNVNPQIVGVRDIANDQGGWIRLTWNPSPLDAWPSSTIRSYAIALGVKTTAISGAAHGASSRGVSNRITSSAPVPAGGQIFWQTVGYVPAKWSQGYSTVVQTYADSGLQGVPEYYFQVFATTADSSVFWTSNVDSGYSIDNIPPVGIKGAAIAGSGPTFITTVWNKDLIDPDLMGYKLYRSTTTGFPLNEGNALALVFDTTYTDANVNARQTYYYRVAAVDIHGNVGPPSAEVIRVASTADVSSKDGMVPLEFTLGPNYPNPFNPTTSLTFSVAVDGAARLKVFDVLGREVATLFEGSAESGRIYEVRFNANRLTSGIYFAVIESGGKQLTQKMMLVK